MVNQNRPILHDKQSFADALLGYKDRLHQSGLEVVQTFDLQQTGKISGAPVCPDHGANPCDCQMVVLLVYGKSTLPVSLLVEGHNGQTWLSLVELPGDTNTRLEVQIYELMK